MNLKNYLKLKKETEKGFTIQKFCENVGISRQQIHKYFLRKAFPSSTTIKNISAATSNKVQANDFYY